MVEQRLRFVATHLAWLLGTLFILVAFGGYTVDKFVAVAVVGFYLADELTAHYGVRPAWRRRVRPVGALWVVLFAVVAALNVARIVASVT